MPIAMVDHITYCCNDLIICLMKRKYSCVDAPHSPSPLCHMPKNSLGWPNFGSFLGDLKAGMERVWED